MCPYLRQVLWNPKEEKEIIDKHGKHMQELVWEPNWRLRSRVRRERCLIFAPTNNSVTRDTSNKLTY